MKKKVSLSQNFYLGCVYILSCEAHKHCRAENAQYRLEIIFNVQLCIYSKKYTETKRISILLLAKTKINRLSYGEILMQMKIILISVFLVFYAHLLIFVFADVSSFKTGNYKATRFSSALLFFDAFIVFHLESP